MTVRTSKKTVTFGRPFTIKGIEEVLPAGAYSIETDEEPLEGIFVYRLPAGGDTAPCARIARQSCP